MLGSLEIASTFRTYVHPFFHPPINHSHQFMRAVEGTERVDGTTALVSVVLGQKLYVANGGSSLN